MSNAAREIIEKLAKFDSIEWDDLSLVVKSARLLLASGAEIITQEPKLVGAFVSSDCDRSLTPIQIKKYDEASGLWATEFIGEGKFRDRYGIDPPEYGTGAIYDLELHDTPGRKRIARKAQS